MTQQEIKNCTRRILNVHMDDIRQYFLNEFDDRNLYEGLMTNTYRYMEILYAAADNCLERINKKTNENGESLTLNNGEEVIDTVEELRERRMKQSKLPVYLYANFEIWLIPGEDVPINIKNVDADRVGSLSLIEADVTRVGLLKPRVQVATYECDTCHNHTYKAVEGPNFMPLTDCTICLGAKNVRGTLKFHPKFVFLH
ncbi:bifunctional Mini-chromosome maintenance protein/MCM N-terminal domain/Nucleic acid-binding [Babesia duncani]|uniref:Bifunctional Mini-chromosome maintenance protein/MCM N-terminal domain/Nucleic acid-binding n=1 Tax=Babesia duncani TaxID=323732 RepID=A0AAD9PGY7_9APIC|nr:bifunctional Mini-chromosome maintenance protein/MCM N-terminal domain/Nucleic acid-binding [Babesia duncani]